MLTVIGSLLSGALGIGKSYLEGRAETKKKELDIKHAALENKARLLREEGSHNHEWEMANLEDKDKFLRRTSFLILMAPFLLAPFFPGEVNTYFTVTMSVIPEWYVQIVVGIYGGMWGLAHLKKGIPAIVGGIKAAIKK